MPAPSPRKRRSQSPPPARGGSPLPWVALVAGVIVAGLGIGALISAYQNRGTPPPQLGAGIPVVTPVPQVTPAPAQSPLAVPSASSTPSPAPSPTRSPRPSPAPTASPSATPVASPSAAPSAAPLPSANASAVPSPPPVPSTPPAIRPTVAPTARPTSTPVEPTATPRAAPAPSPTPTHAPDAVATVRRYLDALIAGNTSAAAALLGAGGTEKEAAFLDDTARITSVRVTRTDAGGTFVDAEISAARGSYVATFHVTNAAGGGTIDQHDYIKV